MIAAIFIIAAVLWLAGIALTYGSEWAEEIKTSASTPNRGGPFSSALIAAILGPGAIFIGLLSWGMCGCERPRFGSPNKVKRKPMTAKQINATFAAMPEPLSIDERYETGQWR